MAWYHVGGCDCPEGNCFCGPPSLPPTEEELNTRFPYVYYGYNEEYEIETIITESEKRKPRAHKSWRFIYLGTL